MNTRQDIRHHLGEREFLDYPVFLEATLGERGVVLTRAIIAVVGVAAVGLTAFFVLG